MVIINNITLYSCTYRILNLRLLERKKLGTYAFMNQHTRIGEPHTGSLLRGRIVKISVLPVASVGEKLSISEQELMQS